MNTTLNPALFASLTSTIVLATATASFAAATQITGVQVIPASNGVQLQLQTKGGDRPQVFAVPRGNSWVADVINTELSLSSGTNFSQQNPADGIQSITIAPLDSNSVRITITGQTAAPDAQLTDRANNTLTFGVIPNTGKETTAQSIAVPPISQPSTSQPIAQAAPVKEPEVLFPNPEITITDNGQATPIPRQNPAPAFLPRAVAPPLGDIAVSNLVPNIGNDVDLGTAQRVPRLALRDAPAREVLSLLARAAGLNLAYIGDGSGSSGSSDTTNVASAGAEGPSITLDIENEPVQDVFNYVLKLTELKAVRQGRTILVGPELPQDTRNTIIRSLRINQASAGTVAGFLSAQGAETQRVVTKTTRSETGSGVDKRILEETTTTIEPLAASTSSTGAPLVLQGLSIITDDRLNSVTLIGDPPLVELATSLTRQLDLRQRQVAVNVKVIDITLDNTASFTSSFSFAVDDAFIVSDEGSAAVNVGEFAPAGLNDANDGTLNRPLITNPYSGLPVGVDFNDVITVPSAPGRGIQIINNTTGQIVGEIPVTGGAFARNPILTDDARQRILQVTDGTAGELRFTDSNANGVFDSSDAISSFRNATLGTLTQSLPSQIRYPSDILLRLRAQVESGNAKILTDPTLVVQENQSASVNLTAKVVTNVTETAGTGDNAIPAITNEFEDVGLVITIGVPRVDDNGFVTMEIQPRISSATQTQTVQTRQGPFQVAQVAKRELNSGRVRLRDGQSLILAGIIQEQDLETITKWPILGDIPILGALFRNSVTNKTRNEVIIVVTPQILDDSDASNFGYSYTPSPEVQKILDQRNPR